MDPSVEDSAVLSALEEAVCSDPEIAFAVGFGSHLSGKSTAASDFDVAVKFTEEVSERDRFEKRCFLSGDLQHEECPFIDVSDIETLPLDVAHDAVNGELLCGDAHAFEQFKADIEAEFEEHRETLRRKQRAVIDRIVADGLRG